MLLYHITHQNSLDSILKRGIVPKYECLRRGLTCYRSRDRFVWLTDNPQYIIETQAASGWPTCILQIALTENSHCVVPALSPSPYDKGSAWITRTHEFITERVHPDQITDMWKMKNIKKRS